MLIDTLPINICYVLCLISWPGTTTTSHESTHEQCHYQNTAVRANFETPFRCRPGGRVSSVNSALVFRRPTISLRASHGMCQLIVSRWPTNNGRSGSAHRAASNTTKCDSRLTPVILYSSGDNVDTLYCVAKWLFSNQSLTSHQITSTDSRSSLPDWVCVCVCVILHACRSVLMYKTPQCTTNYKRMNGLRMNKTNRLGTTILDYVLFVSVVFVCLCRFFFFFVMCVCSSRECVSILLALSATTYMSASMSLCSGVDRLLLPYKRRAMTTTTTRFGGSNSNQAIASNASPRSRRPVDIIHIVSAAHCVRYIKQCILEYVRHVASMNMKFDW